MDRLKILVVDDESRMRKLVSDFLVRNDYDVLEAGDGETAMEIFFAQKDIALIVLDVMMPKMDGWQVCWEWMNISQSPSARRFWLRGLRPFSAEPTRPPVRIF